MKGDMVSTQKWGSCFRVRTFILHTIIWITKTNPGEWKVWHQSWSCDQSHRVYTEYWKSRTPAGCFGRSYSYSWIFWVVWLLWVLCLSQTQSKLDMPITCLGKVQWWLARKWWRVTFWQNKCNLQFISRMKALHVHNGFNFRFHLQQCRKLSSSSGFWLAVPRFNREC